jgi:hypothetical protein
MTRYQIDFTKLITWLLPRLKRKTVRITWLYSVMVRIRAIHADFISTGSKLAALAKVNSQIINLEAYLITRFGEGITIAPQAVLTQQAVVKHQNDAALGGVIVAAGQTPLSFVYHQNQSTSIYNATVTVPAELAVDLSELAAVLDKYKVPGSTYLIIEE